MEVLKETFKDERKFENFIRDIPSTLQRSPTKNSKTSGQECGFFDDEHRRSDDPSCHCMGCSCPLLCDQHWQTSEVFDSFQSADEMAVSTFRPVGEVDIDFRARTRGPGTHEQTMADSNKCGMEVEKTKVHNDLVRSIDNRKQECQETNNKFTTASRFRVPSSLSSGCEWESENESSAMAVRKLCRNEHIVPSSITETQANNQNSCNRNNGSRNESTLLELRNDHDRDLPSLLKLLKNKEPYHEETNKNVFNDVEIRLFAGLYGITNFHLLLACKDSVFWIKDHDGVIYFYSRIDDSMIRGGDNLKEALTNYLFHQENLYYVDEITRKLVPINAYDEEVEEWAKSHKPYVINETKVSPKHESKMGGEKKQQKKKKNKKKH